jgi:hypothetical protein
LRYKLRYDLENEYLEKDFERDKLVNERKAGYLNENKYLDEYKIFILFYLKFILHFSNNYKDIKKDLIS